MATSSFLAFLVERDSQGKFVGRVTEVSKDRLPAGEVLIRVAYSSLNYKDALSATGNPGVTRNFPHIPGIDASGTVVESASPLYQPGNKVLVTGYDMGQNTWGGFAEYIRVPVGWVVPLPRGISLRESMVYGTAGFTAALSLAAIRQRKIRRKKGDVVVTGATGGVGSLAVMLLARRGYNVVAVTGKPEQRDYLFHLGAASVISREEILGSAEKPLLPARWAAAVDTVGGETLGSIVRALHRGGCACACGLVGGAQLNLTVFPFLLRGVDLVGIASADTPYKIRTEVWRMLGDKWKPRGLASIASEIPLEGLPEKIDEILRGRVVGRIVIDVGMQSSPEGDG